MLPLRVRARTAICRAVPTTNRMTAKAKMKELKPHDASDVLTELETGVVNQRNPRASIATIAEKHKDKTNMIKAPQQGLMLPPSPA